ncbi:Deoxyguanosinetriphosphate triphosphohydrolase [Winogradskyella psychrotolerans RS-3]|uniref:Deoxyguanosinetriphosphate triphosphohydrolase n=1 Tax=Winogradskyella psychrotolerans RS-3 TaxID=641526 RepID=S7VUJ1_9FLAO|nr:Deoxyguanosinetriphosphate triphosphohydrolase [Winogradskyella psychrotolerans RS-3]
MKKDLPKTGKPDWLDDFAQLDDLDIWGAIKLWKDLDDLVLSQISKMFLTRNLYKIHLSNQPLITSKVAEMKSKVQKKLMVSDEELNYFSRKVR